MPAPSQPAGIHPRRRFARRAGEPSAATHSHKVRGHGPNPAESSSMAAGPLAAAWAHRLRVSGDAGAEKPSSKLASEMRSAAQDFLQARRQWVDSAYELDRKPAVTEIAFLMTPTSSSCASTRRLSAVDRPQGDLRHGRQGLQDRGQVKGSKPPGPAAFWFGIIVPMPERVLIMGGSFDPPHKGHKTLLIAAAKALRPERVLLIPAFQAPLKGIPGAPAGQRVEMLRAMVTGLPKNLRKLCSIDLSEVRGRRRVYTVETSGLAEVPRSGASFVVGRTQRNPPVADPETLDLGSWWAPQTGL